MSTVTNIRAVAPALPEIVGYVEAVTADRLLGWAWAPASPDQRAAIELRLGDDIIARSVADLPRADLAANRIGDGRHAYEIAIPSEVQDRATELRVFARLGEGEAFPIGATPAADGLSDQVSRLTRGVDMLLNSQRLIHRNLQTALTGSQASESEPVTAALARMTELQERTEAQICDVERFVVRLDEHLSRLAPKSIPAERFPAPAIWALAGAGLALVVSVAGLIHALAG